MVRVIGALLSAVLLVQAQPAPARADGAVLRSRIRAYLDDWRAGGTFPGAALGVAIKGSDAFAVTTGVSDRATGRPVTPDDLFMAGSTGKTFFAAVALQLIEAGVLDLDAPIAKYLGQEPWFSRLPNASSITIRHLMTHTSGLVRYEMNPKFTADLRAQPTKQWTPEEEIAYLFGTPPPFAPGQGWDYSDTNYIVLGMIIERTTRTRLYDEVRNRFLDRLLLTHVVPTTSRRLPGLVPGYAGARDPLGFPDEVMKDGELVVSPQFEWAGGGYATTPLDLARWGLELYAGSAISEKARRMMLDAAVPARLGPETKYGLGVIVRPATPAGPAWGHSGFYPGYQTELLYFPDAGVSLALQINSSAARSTGTRSLLRVLYDVAAMVKQ